MECIAVEMSVQVQSKVSMEEIKAYLDRTFDLFYNGYEYVNWEIIGVYDGVIYVSFVYKMGDPRLIFVYGTLKKGFYNHDRCLGVDGVEFLGKSGADGFTLYMVGSAYPAAVEEYGSVIKGELYKVPAKVFNHIDRMEEGAGYSKKEVNGAIIWYYNRSKENNKRLSKHIGSVYLKKHER